MKNEIVTNIDTPEKLERLYRRDKFQFEDWLVEAIKMFPNSETLRVWHARVNYTPSPSGKRENKGVEVVYLTGEYIHIVLDIVLCYGGHHITSELEHNEPYVQCLGSERDTVAVYL